MEPVLWPEPFDGPGWVFQIKWDGMRVLTAVGDRGGRTNGGNAGDGGAGHEGIRAFNRHGFDRTAWFPELTALPELLSGAQAVVDGEAVALLGGKSSFRRLMQRVRSREPARLQH